MAKNQSKRETFHKIIHHPFSVESQTMTTKRIKNGIQFILNGKIIGELKMGSKKDDILF